MTDKNELSLLNIVLTISEAVDMVSPDLADHHSRVAYIVYRLADALGYSQDEKKTLTIAGAMHDIGVLSLNETRALTKFEIETRPDHGEVGYLYLNSFGPLTKAGAIIRDHHVYWDYGAGEMFCGHAVMPDSHLIHLADRIAVLIDPGQDVLTQVESIREKIVEQSGRMFVPRFVHAFLDIADKEFFWLDAVSPTVNWHLVHDGAWDVVSLDGTQFMELARLFCQIVDFKSPFTAAHSSGVAACAGMLGQFSGLSEAECNHLTTAGYLHDIGKLSVPLEILEKPDVLDDRETAVIRHHSYQTFKILQKIGLDESFRNWSAYHHERLDGSGYPFHVGASQLTPGCRIMAVADVFTALVEKRPYRSGLSRQEAMPILHKMTSRGWLDGDLVETVSENFDEMDAISQQAEEIALQEYASFALAKHDYEQKVMV
ncbi:MAG TPA: HD domain-containing phosphohydrolase [Anaerolineales bacterium]|nr:HD domain-containing phosphohydrolase [Anaerolineales bacterium]